MYSYPDSTLARGGSGPLGAFIKRNTQNTATPASNSVIRMPDRLRHSKSNTLPSRG